jgi:hypothetical protein
MSSLLGMYHSILTRQTLFILFYFIFSVEHTLHAPLWVFRRGNQIEDQRRTIYPSVETTCPEHFPRIATYFMCLSYALPTSAGFRHRHWILDHRLPIYQNPLRMRRHMFVFQLNSRFFFILIFGNLDIAKEIWVLWDMLAQCYNTNNLAQRFQIVTKLNHMRQKSRQNIVDFYSQMTYLWI